MGLALAVLATARQEWDTQILIYADGQPAQLSTFGQYLAGVLEVLIRDGQRLCDAREALEYCPMGAVDLTTPRFTINRHRMAPLLVFAAPLRNSYAATTSVDHVTGIYSAIKLLILHLSRGVQDIQFWTTPEVGQLDLPKPMVAQPEKMPHAQPFDRLRHLASQTLTKCDVVVNAVRCPDMADMGAGAAAFVSTAEALALLQGGTPCLHQPRGAGGAKY